jgi:hypothetical protein
MPISVAEADSAALGGKADISQRLPKIAIYEYTPYYLTAPTRNKSRLLESALAARRRKRD